MDTEKKIHYRNVLLNAYNNGTLKIVWNTSGFSLGIDPQKEASVPELREDAFIDYAFSIIKKVADMAGEKELTDPDDCGDIETARVIYNQENDLKNHLYIKRNSKINCYRRLESQIISHRNEENPQETDATSAIIKIVTEKDDEDTSFTFEISRRDLGDIIENFLKLKANLDSI